MRRSDRASKNIVRADFVASNVAENFGGQKFIILRRKFNVAVEETFYLPVDAVADRLLRVPINFASKSADADNN